MNLLRVLSHIEKMDVMKKYQDGQFLEFRKGKKLDDFWNNLTAAIGNYVYVIFFFILSRIEDVRGKKKEFGDQISSENYEKIPLNLLI